MPLRSSENGTIIRMNLNGVKEIVAVEADIYLVFLRFTGVTIAWNSDANPFDGLLDFEQWRVHTSGGQQRILTRICA